MPPIDLAGDDSERGLQRHLYEALRQNFLRHALAPGERLPSSRALAQELSLSRTTVVLVMERLRAEGYIVMRPGAGTFVASELPDDCLNAVAEPVPVSSRAGELSERGRKLAATPAIARRLHGHARAFRLGSPALDLFPIQIWQRLLMRNVRSCSPSALDYSWPVGIQKLREAIAMQLGSRGVKCSAEQVIVTSGAQRGLDLLCHLLLDPGDVLWLEDPGFPGAWNACTNAGVHAEPVPLDAQGFHLDWALRHANPARVLYTTPSHQFPLGGTMSLARRRELVSWAQRAKRWIIEDDYDCEFHHSGRPLPSLLALDGAQRVLYLGTFSKSLFPALRLGYMVVPTGLWYAILDARSSSDLHPPTLEQMTLADFMLEGHYQAHLRRMRKVYRERLEALQDAARAHCGSTLQLLPVSAGQHVAGLLKGIDDEAVYHQAVQRDIDVTPLSRYWLNSAERRSGLLLGFGAVPSRSLRTGMQRLARAIEVARS